MEPITLAVLALATGTVLNYQQQREAYQDQKEANASRGRLQEIQANRERARAIQEQRIVAARIQAAEAAGQSTGSVATGMVGSTQSQLASNIGFMNQSMALQGNIFANEQRAQQHRDRGAMYQSVGNTIFQSAGMVG